ncbi:lytic transglycosylase domain-containing protein [Mycolicibacterium pulveris]|uniref:lytic transglycosylase domain-containing protein n=1 Tax=Mycolicibacterium pulveris TaxID=36813 RepID=UPI003CE9E3DB
MQTGGNARARTTMERIRRRLSQAVRSPAAGANVIARMVVTSAVATAPSLIVAVHDDPGIHPLAAVAPQPAFPAGPLAAARPAGPSTVAQVVGPPPPAAVSAPGVVNIPAAALTAYRNADGLMAQAEPGCGLSWNLLAGIGQIESRHAFGGKTDDHGTAVEPIFGPTLDGSLPGNEIIVAGRFSGRTVYARAMGPMQFLPSTWVHYAADGNGDGQADPQNLFDATLAAGRYLCSGGVNLRDRSQLISAVLRYNNSMPYTLNVLGWAEAYATGVPPGYLPPITGPLRPVGTTRPVARPANAGSTETRSEATQSVPEETRTQTWAERNSGSSTAGSSTSPRTGSSSTDSPATSATGSARTGSSGATTGAGTADSSSPRVKIGNGRTGGARGSE